MSADPALDVLQWIREAGVRTVCVCPGARNADWVRLLATPDCGFEVFWFPEERSASFFALGRMRATGQPAAVVTTSGTAVGELLPAVMEAYYSGWPLILLTADRPRRYRGSGAPQAAEQAGIFGLYAPTAFDLEGGQRLPEPLQVGRTPIHINVCFEDPNSTAAREHPSAADSPSPEPPTDSEETAAGPALAAEIGRFRRPIAIVGSLAPRDRTAVETFLCGLGAPVYAESLSGLRSSEKLEPLAVRVADRLLARASRCGYEPDVVVRIGGVPTHRLWRDLEDLDLPVVSVSDLEFSGLGRKSTHFRANLSALYAAETRPVERRNDLIQADRRVVRCLEELLAQEPNAEPSMFRMLSELIPGGRISAEVPRTGIVYLGNSLPVREWDLAASWRPDGPEIRASRGLNGIDGQISTFLGMCRAGFSNWAILGDLTAIYDLAGPWPLAQMPKNLDANLVVINNGGGKIFDRMFPEPAFQNRHGVAFEHWAAMWGLGYERAESAQDLASAARRSHKGPRVLEVIPDEESTRRFWTAYNEALA